MRSAAKPSRFVGNPSLANIVKTGFVGTDSAHATRMGPDSGRVRLITSRTQPPPSTLSPS